MRNPWGLPGKREWVVIMLKSKVNAKFNNGFIPRSQCCQTERTHQCLWVLSIQFRYHLLCLINDYDSSRFVCRFPVQRQFAEV